MLTSTIIFYHYHRHHNIGFNKLMFTFIWFRLFFIILFYKSSFLVIAKMTIINCLFHSGNAAHREAFTHTKKCTCKLWKHRKKYSSQENATLFIGPVRAQALQPLPKQTTAATTSTTAAATTSSPSPTSSPETCSTSCTDVKNRINRRISSRFIGPLKFSGILTRTLFWFTIQSVSVIEEWILLYSHWQLALVM